MHDLKCLVTLSDDKCHVMTYQQAELDRWNANDSTLLASSNAPTFLKEILTHKQNARPHLFFGEAFVAAQLGDTIKDGWFNSWDWISSYAWFNGKYSKSRKDPLIDRLKKEFYDLALKRYIDREKFADLMQLQKYASHKPEPPDLWLIDTDDAHHFIEVKRDNDTLSDEQAVGLVLIELAMKHKTHLIWLYEEHSKPPKDKITRCLERYRDIKARLRHTTRSQ